MSRGGFDHVWLWTDTCLNEFTLRSDGLCCLSSSLRLVIHIVVYNNKGAVHYDPVVGACSLTLPFSLSLITILYIFHTEKFYVCVLTRCSNETHSLGCHGKSERKLAIGLSLSRLLPLPISPHRI